MEGLGAGLGWIEEEELEAWFSSAGVGVRVRPAGSYPREIQDRWSKIV